MRSFLYTACAAAMLCIAVACGSTSPTAPGPAPSGPGRLEVTITPNPVPYSEPPAPGCSFPHTWQYTQILRNTGGTAITISDRVNFFDDARTGDATNLGLVVEPGGAHTVTPQTRWCSPNNIEHTARTDWSGSDANGGTIGVTGPNVQLLPK